MVVDIAVVMMLNDVVDITVDFCRIWLNFLDVRRCNLLLFYGITCKLGSSRAERKYCA